MHCSEDTAPDCQMAAFEDAPDHPTGIYVLSHAERQSLHKAWTKHVLAQEDPWHQSLASARENIFEEVFCSALEGLVDHLRCARHTSAGPMLPSLLVHRLWRVWEADSPSESARVAMLCAGRLISSADCTPAISSAMTDDQVHALASSWVGAYRAAGIQPGVTTIPPVFHIDSRFSVPGGWLFVFKREQLLGFEIDQMGDLHGSGQPQTWLMPMKLHELGLITESEQAGCEQLRSLRSRFWSWFFANLLHEGQHAADLEAFRIASKSHPGKKKAA